MPTVKRFRIEGKLYLAETADSAYAQHMEGWRAITELQGGFKPLVPVFVEHPERFLSALEKGVLGHEQIEEFLKKQEPSPTETGLGRKPHK